MSLKAKIGMLVLIISMDDWQVRSLEQIQAFLDGSSGYDLPGNGVRKSTFWWSSR